MIIDPKVREYICTTAHPKGCEESVRRQIAYVKSQKKMENGPKRVLIIGASTGYGLASRITASFGCGAATLGIMFERPSNGKRTATAGWYNTAAFEKFAKEEGLYAKSLNGDAFSAEMKEKVIETIKNDWGKADMVIYSLAAPRRTDKDGTVYTSSLKTTGDAFTEKSLDLKNNTVGEKTIEPATEEELKGTIKVMGGEDWEDWIHALTEADVLTEDAVTIAYSYIGPELTYPIYYNGTIGNAKKHLTESAKRIGKNYPVQAYVSVNKGLVTQASAAIPIVPLYFTILYKVMKEQNVHEGCIEQIARLFEDRLYNGSVKTDEEGMIRIDDWELDEKVQSEVRKAWKEVTTENMKQYCDIDGYWDDFYHMFGFNYDNVDYQEDVDPMVEIPSLQA